MLYIVDVEIINGARPKVKQPGTDKEERPVQDKEPTMADMEEGMEGKISNKQVRKV